jgi:hypothetical protein
MENEITKKIYKFFSPLKTRDGVANAEPGRWKEAVNVSHIATVAKNLDTSRARTRQDKLYSVPTPWARALLFESALYDAGHPAHMEVRDQWRGLLGLLALADALGLSGRVRVQNLDLDSQPQGELKDAFISLRPQHASPEGNLEDGKWGRFGLIFFDRILVGSSSPRTIVFTSITHEPLRGIAFLSKEGRLDDPTKYLKADAPELLEVLGLWIEDLIGKIGASEAIRSLMGTRPADPTANAVSRRSKVLIALQEWKKEIEGALQGWSADMEVPTSNAVLESESWQLPEAWEIIGRVVGVSSELPFIHNPQAYLEPALIEVKVAPDAVHALSVQGRYYLLPFTRQLVHLLSYDQLVKAAQNSRVKDINSETYSFETQIQLASGKTIQVRRIYAQSNIVSSADEFHPTQRLAMWPDFAVSPDSSTTSKRGVFDSYFFYASDVGENQVVFSPVTDAPVKREFDRSTWYLFNEPIKGFTGSVDGKSGFLLIKYNQKRAPTKLWKVGVDFGSTHTSAFYIEVHEEGTDLKRDRQSQISPIKIMPRVRILTQGDQFQMQENFFIWNPQRNSAAAGTHSDQSPIILTQLVLPMDRPEDVGESWLPREGQIFLASLLESKPVHKLEVDLKWNRDAKDFSTRSFLRSLMILLKAEAAFNEASIARVAHSYPSAFPKDLEAKHTGEWTDLASSVGVEADERPLTEALAVCRHLRAEQGGMPSGNVVALDIGGSTTDIALWADRNLKVQESIKIAAGTLSRYIELFPAFQRWFLQKIQDVPFKIRVKSCTPEEADRKIFNSALNRLTQLGLINAFMDHVQADKGLPEVRSFLSYMIFLFSAISYFAGLIARRAHMGEIEEYYLYFCGRGGQYYLWMPRAKEIVAEAFNAGRIGPSGASIKSNIESRPSAYPKQEAGRGLLIDYKELTVTENGGRTTGALDEPQETVTAAEDGYPGFTWSSALTNDSETYEKLKKAVKVAPSVGALKEMKWFLKNFCDSPLTRDIADKLDVQKHFNSPRYRVVLHERLLNNVSDSIDHALIEPFFITEIKALVHVLSGSDVELFD